MSEYRYQLERNSKKHVCPECGKRRFVRYIDTNMGEYLPEQYGRCDRETNCQYHLNPYADGYAKRVWEKEQGLNLGISQPKPYRPKKRPKPKPVYFPINLLEKTLHPEGYRQNGFIQNLLFNVPFPFAQSDIEKVVGQYFLGSICKGYRRGAITFPFIDNAHVCPHTHFCLSHHL